MECSTGLWVGFPNAWSTLLVTNSHRFYGNRLLEYARQMQQMPIGKIPPIPLDVDIQPLLLSLHLLVMLHLPVHLHFFSFPYS